MQDIEEIPIPIQHWRQFTFFLQPESNAKAQEAFGQAPSAPVTVNISTFNPPEYTSKVDLREEATKSPPPVYDE